MPNAMTTDPDQPTAFSFLEEAAKRFGEPEFSASQWEAIKEVCEELQTTRGYECRLNRVGSWRFDAEKRTPCPEKQLPGTFLSWLCTYESARDRIDHAGIVLDNFEIDGTFDISEASISFPLRFWNCIFSGEIHLERASLPFLSFRGSTINSLKGQGLRVNGCLELGHGFKAINKVYLNDAIIKGNVNCGGGSFLHAKGRANEYSISADRINISGDLRINQLPHYVAPLQFKAENGVSIVGGHIGGDLNASGAILESIGVALGGPAPASSVNYEYLSLKADGIVVHGCVNLNSGFTARGEVRFPGAQIDGILDCQGGSFQAYPDFILNDYLKRNWENFKLEYPDLNENAPKDGDPFFLLSTIVLKPQAALYLPGSLIKGRVQLNGAAGTAHTVRKQFRSIGNIYLSTTQIHRNLNCKFAAIQSLGHYLDGPACSGSASLYSEHYTPSDHQEFFTALELEGADIGGTLALGCRDSHQENTFECLGQIKAPCVKIGRDLNITRGLVSCRGWVVIDARSAEIGASVHLDSSEFGGGLCFKGANIKGGFESAESTFDYPFVLNETTNDAEVLNIDIGNPKAEAELRRITSEIHFKPCVVHADRANVERTVAFRKLRGVKGVVSFASAKIGGTFQWTSTSTSIHSVYSDALRRLGGDKLPGALAALRLALPRLAFGVRWGVLTSLVVLSLSRLDVHVLTSATFGFALAYASYLFGPKAGTVAPVDRMNLYIYPSIDLRRTRIKTLLIDGLIGNPEMGIMGLELDGIEVETLSSRMLNVPTDHIRYLLKLRNHFSPQPYEQLAHVLRRLGRAEVAADILVEKEREMLRAALVDRKSISVTSLLVWHGLLGVMDYGIKADTFFKTFLLFFMGGWIVFHQAYVMDVIVPIDRLAYVNFNSKWREMQGLDGAGLKAREEAIKNPRNKEESERHLEQDQLFRLGQWMEQSTQQRISGESFPTNYPVFYSAIYTLDIMLPVVDLQTARFYGPAVGGGHPRWGIFVRVVMWIEIVSGWVFATLLLARLSGVIKK